MFSSRFYSPKQWLAAQLSQAVAEYFDVDPQRVETNLLKDSKVVLYDLELKPQPYEKSLIVSGRIHKVEFAWTWEASAALITNVTFSMEGVHVYVKRQSSTKEDQDQHQDPIIESISGGGGDAADDGEVDNNKDSSSSSDWKSKYFQQILDHLKLLVTDFTVHIQLDSSNDDNDNSNSEEDHNISELVVQAKDIQVETVSRKSDSILCQRLVLGSLGAWIQSKTGSEAIIHQHPVLEPFGYEATVQRISGRRFVDGITKGLMIQGKLDEGASAIRLHAGVAQIQALTQLQQVLLNDSSSSPAEKSSEPSSIPALLEAKESSNTTQVVPSITSDPSDSSSTAPPGADYSVFSLPLHSMAVVLEGGAEFRLQDLMIRYCADGSELDVTCRQGLWNDATQFGTGTYTLDFIRNEFRVGATDDDDDEEFFQDAQSEPEINDVEDENIDNNSTNANNRTPNERTVRLDLTVGMLVAAYQGMHAIFPNVAEELVVQEEDQVAKVDGEVPWTVQVEGNLRMRVTDKARGKWIECNVDHPKVIISNSIEHSSFEWRTLQIGPSSFGSFHVSVPALVTADENNLPWYCSVS
jgi:hypothetical protein